MQQQALDDAHLKQQHSGKTQLLDLAGAQCSTQRPQAFDEAHLVRRQGGSQVVELEQVQCSTQRHQAVGGAHLRQQQVEQTPELLQLILQRCAGEQQAPQCGEAVQVPSQLALPVLHALCLVNDDVLPLHLSSTAQVCCFQQEWSARHAFWAGQRTDNCCWCVH